jgi:hypothetical protein
MMFTESNFQNIYDLASDAGWEAGAENTPGAVVWQNSHSGKTYAPCFEGVCGFAWVIVPDENVSPPGARRKWVKNQFGLWLIRMGHASRYSDVRGARLSVREFDQSLDRKYAYAKAFAKVLEYHGIPASAHERMD